MNVCNYTSIVMDNGIDISAHLEQSKMNAMNVKLWSTDISQELKKMKIENQALKERLHVEKIVCERTKDDDEQYLIRWKDTWEMKRNINSSNILRNWENKKLMMNENQNHKRRRLNDKRKKSKSISNCHDSNVVIDICGDDDNDDDIDKLHKMVILPLSDSETESEDFDVIINL